MSCLPAETTCWACQFQHCLDTWMSHQHCTNKSLPVAALCRSNLSTLSSATIWSNGGSTDVNNMSSKLLHGLSQMDPETLTSMSSGLLHVQYFAPHHACELHRHQLCAQAQRQICFPINITCRRDEILTHSSLHSLQPLDYWRCKELRTIWTASTATYAACSRPLCTKSTDTHAAQTSLYLHSKNAVLTLHATTSYILLKVCQSQCHLHQLRSLRAPTCSSPSAPSSCAPCAGPQTTRTSSSPRCPTWVLQDKRASHQVRSC